MIALRSDGGPRKVLAIGEVKSSRAMGIRDLDRLIRIRELLRRRDEVDARGTRLLLFSGGGFSDGLHQLQQIGNMILVDLEGLYRED